MAKMHITLIGKDGCEHASGIVEFGKVIDSHLVQHNGRLYYFKPSPSISNHVFEECEQPYIITEF